MAMLKGPSRSALPQVGIEGSLMTLAPAPFILACTLVGSGFPPLWRLASATMAALFCLAAALLLLRRPSLGRIVGALAVLAGITTAFPYLASNPFAALLGAAASISAASFLYDFRVLVDENHPSTHGNRCLQRARWSTLTVPLLVGLAVVLDASDQSLVAAALAAATLVSQILTIHWAWNRTRFLQALAWTTGGVVAATGVVFAFFSGHGPLAALAAGSATRLLLPRSAMEQEELTHWWETLLNHPARVLLTTFLGLCFVGTLVLLLPGAARQEAIAPVDAAFTSVSAVCVTGLITLDTPNAFTLFGQAAILLLIQLGGLGIMTITTVALHALGRRLSLRQERLLTSMTATDHQDLLASLVTIIRFTFVAEALGALLLATLFHATGESPGQAAWQGIFTAVSAFCNAGFALQSTNLMPYQHNPAILHVVALLIIFGGLAPATGLLVPRWLAGRAVPLGARLALITTTILLFGGAFFFLIFEWNGVLAGLSLLDKLHNAWFQSVTLRTAGFNSVDIAKVSGPTYLVMLCLMFTGGSPGGTAGGIKTTTLGVLALTFWASCMGHNEVIVRNRLIPGALINRAITIVGSGLLIWLGMVTMLEITQQIAARDLIFEVTSALGTVGLSTGATVQLDGIGKILIMITMFVGRIGPMTMFMLLSEERPGSASRCPEARTITLT